MEGGTDDGEGGGVELHDAELALADGDEESVALVSRGAEATAEHGDGAHGAVEVELGHDLEGYLLISRARGGGSRVGVRRRLLALAPRGATLGMRDRGGGEGRVVAAGLASDREHRQVVRLGHHEVRRTPVADRMGEVRRARVVHPGGRVHLLVHGERHGARTGGISARSTLSKGFARVTDVQP